MILSKIKSLTVKLRLLFAIVLFVLIVVFGHIIYHVQMANVNERLESAHRLVLENGGILLKGQDEQVNHWLLTVTGDDYEVQALGGHGTGGRGQRQGNRYREEMRRHLDDGLEAFFAESLDDQAMAFYAVDNGAINGLVSYLGEDQQGKVYLLSVHTADHRMIFLPLLALILIIAAVAAAATIFIANYITKPLKQLEKYAVRIAHKQWSQPIKVNSEDEVGRLIHAMNDMQALLKQSEEEQKAFLQSISHDLKTPVAVIMGHAQAIMDGVYIDSVENTARIIQEEAVRLEGKVKKILYFNTLDYSLENQSMQEVIKIDELLQDLVCKFKPMASHIQWSVQAEALTFVADHDNLQVALENIIDNAIRYARTSIMLREYQQEGQLVIEVINDGELIAPEKISGIFDHLAKDKKGKFGLGLFISKKIINHYGGKIWAENGIDQVSFMVALPLTSPNNQGGRINEKD